MDIKDKLRQLDSLALKRDTGRAQPSTAVKPNIASVIAGTAAHNDFGSFRLVEESFAEDYQHGAVAVSDLLQRDAASFPIVGKNADLGNIDLSRLLFIDTETTGLSGGAGTCAFLVGVGFFEEGRFRVQQFFMNDFHEEAAMLHALNELVQRFDCLVSYNGKSFDLPLLISRNILHGLASPLTDLRHFDLLHTVRRLWKHRLSECSLLNVEKHLTGMQRSSEDIPGFLIPQTYFQYLRRKDATPLKPVFYHNQQDIIAMAALLNLALAFVEQPVENASHAADILALGNLLQGLNRFEESVALCEAYLQRGTPDIHRHKLLLLMGRNLKRLRKFPQAAAVWHRYIETERFHPLPYIELAKHCEHRTRELQKAQKYVDKALAELAVLEQLGIKAEWAAYKEDLLYRRRRLQAKSAANRPA